MVKSVRKGKKRTHKQPPVDDDLNMLASVLAEMQLDNNAYGWFRPPWRDGINAARLARMAAFRIDPAEMCSDESATLISSLVMANEARVYEQAGEIYSKLVQTRVNTDAARLLAACVRCLQLKIARSDGGGDVYNEILIPAFLPIELAIVSDIVLDFRCQDSIGTTSRLRGDHNDRQRAAFKIAWQRGLYLAAYSLPAAY